MAARGPGEPMKVVQSENIQFKLDGLVLLLEGTCVSYDDSASVYRFRSYNDDGRYLETELKLLPRGFAWGFEAGPLKVNNSMRLNETGEWTEIC